MNRAILLTAPGGGAIAVLRLVGPRVEEFLVQYFSRATRVDAAIHGALSDETGAVLDDPVAARPRCDVVDLNLHAGPWIVRQALELARRQGFEPMQPAPLPLDNAAVDPSAADESADPFIEQLRRNLLTHLPLARTEPAVRTLLGQEAAWRNWLASDESDRRRQARAMLEDRALWWLLHPPRVAITGSPNVGKSTLANQLFAQERSIVADQPGTTRDWVGELADINGLAVMLLDTPGQRLSDDPIEREAIRQSGAVIESADLVIEVYDAGEPHPAVADRPDERTLRVANKQDRRIWDADEVGALPLTATTGEGLEALGDAIVRYFGCENIDPTRARWWTAEQRDLLQSLL